MNLQKIFLFGFLLFLIENAQGARLVFDKKGIDISSFFSKSGVTYVIRYNHSFKETISIPPRCNLKFEGGSLKGTIIFENTRLTGKVNLIGSSISGTIQNDFFDASWICNKDGVTDDARLINETLGVCKKIFFPSGRYRLISKFDPTGKVDELLNKSIKAHIGIYCSNVELIGEEETTFLTDKPLGMICIFSPPNNLSDNVKNVQIKNIKFIVKNDGIKFREFLHTIKSIGVNGLLIENCVFSDFWGDAICLSHYGDNPQTGERTRNQNVEIINNCIIGGRHHNNRNGISVINGENIFIRGNTIKNTSRQDMPGGINVEPNNSAYTIDNIVIENNEIEGVRGRGGAIDIVIFKGASGHRIKILSNRILNSSNGIQICVETKETSDSIIIQDNYVDKNTRPYRFKGKGKSKDWIVYGNIFEMACVQAIPGNIEVVNLIVKDNKKKI